MAFSLANRYVGNLYYNNLYNLQSIFYFITRGLGLGFQSNYIFFGMSYTMLSKLKIWFKYLLQNLTNNFSGHI